MARRHQMAPEEAVELILAAAEQHGAEDIDDPDRRVHDLEHAIEEAVRLLDHKGVEALMRGLEAYGTLAGWLV